MRGTIDPAIEEILDRIARVASHARSVRVAFTPTSRIGALAPFLRAIERA